MGVFEHSRGAPAASVPAVLPKEIELRDAAFAAGLYDFKRACDEVEIPGIRTPPPMLGKIARRCRIETVPGAKIV